MLRLNGGVRVSLRLGLGLLPPFDHESRVMEKTSVHHGHVAN